jgi:serine phosphatase RsbU (regulator of sigma subunit)
LLYTDGVTEIYDEAEEEFGVERLLSLVRAMSVICQGNYGASSRANPEFAADRTGFKMTSP